MRIWTLPAATLMVLNFASPAAAEPIGATIKVVNQVTAQFNRDTRSLIEGDGVSQDEVIAVASDALGELVFKDETKLALGPGSEVKLDKFVYDPDKTNGAIAVNLLKGTFRFMTGVATKPTYEIKTPTASITVRGTIFDVYVFADGSSWILLHEGAVAVRNKAGSCRLVDTPGRLVRVTASGKVGIPVKWDELPGSKSMAFDKAFPFVVAPPSVDPRPVFTRAAILAGTPANPNSTNDCDDIGDKPKQAPPQRAGDDSGPTPKKVRYTGDDDAKPGKKTKRVVEDYDPPVKKKKTKRVVEDDNEDKPVYKKPPKVVVYDKPKKTKKPRNDDDDKAAQAAATMAIIGIGAGIAIGSRNRGGGNHMPRGDYGGKGYGGR